MSPEARARYLEAKRARKKRDRARRREENALWREIDETCCKILLA